MDFNRTEHQRHAETAWRGLVVAHVRGDQEAKRSSWEQLKALVLSRPAADVEAMERARGLR